MMVTAAALFVGLASGIALGIAVSERRRATVVTAIERRAGERAVALMVEGLLEEMSEIAGNHEARLAALEFDAEAETRVVKGQRLNPSGQN